MSKLTDKQKYMNYDCIIAHNFYKLAWNYTVHYLLYQIVNSIGQKFQLLLMHTNGARTLQKNVSCVYQTCTVHTGLNYSAGPDLPI